MDDKIVTFTADPPVTRSVYVKTFVLMFIGTEIANYFAQMRLVQAVNMKVSAIIAGVLSLVISYFISRSPATQSLTIDYVKRTVIVGFATLTRAKNLLEIPFDRLGVETTETSGATSPNENTPVKWKTSLLLDGKKVYLYLSSESGFTDKQLNEFNERVLACQKPASS